MKAEMDVPLMSAFGVAIVIVILSLAVMGARNTGAETEAGREFVVECVKTGKGTQDCAVLWEWEMKDIWRGQQAAAEGSH